MVIFLLANLIVGISAFLLTYKIFKFYIFIEYLITLFILYFAQIVSTQLLLGIFGLLSINNLILFNLIILLVIWFITRNKKFSHNFIGIREGLVELLSNRCVLLVTAIILGFGLTKIAINLMNPPFGWDDLNYHFTFPVEWLKHGNLDNPIVVSDDPVPSYYPVNGSLFFLWSILPFKNVFLADLGQIPFFVLAFLAIVSLGIKLNLNREDSYLAACMFTLIPNYFKQMEIAYVDVMLAALFLVCLNYLFLLKKEFSLKNIIIYNITLGLFLGTKAVALPYSFLLFIPLVYLYFNKPCVLFLLSFLVIIVFGGFSYIRNFMEIGNPLYPLNLELFKKTIFKGVIDYNNYRVHFSVEDYRLSKLLFHEGLGLQTLIFILPSIFLALPLTFIKKRKTLNFNLVYFLILPFLIYLEYRYIIPLANTRYLYPLLGMGIVIGFYTVNILNIPRSILRILVIICALSSMPFLAEHLELAASIMVTSLLFLLLFLLTKNIRMHRLKIKLSFWTLVLIIALFVILPFLEKDYVRNEYPRYINMEGYSGFWPDATRAWYWVNKNTKGENIAYVGRPVPFPLYGTNFKNNVYYVSVNSIEPAKIHYFPNSHYSWGDDFLSMHKDFERGCNYRSSADYSIWLNNLLRRNTDYLFIYSLHQTKEIIFPLEDNWAKANPKRFIPVFTNTTIHIYKVFK